MKATTLTPIRVGTGITAAIGLLPVLKDFFVAACFVGALAAVWFAIRKRRQAISFSEGARLGFLSAFFGLLLAGTIYQLDWELLDYQLWQIDNIDRWVSLFGGMIRDALSPSTWLLITLQIVIAAICSGAIGAPAGMLGAKLFQKQVPP